MGCGSSQPMPPSSATGTPNRKGTSSDKTHQQQEAVSIASALASDSQVASKNGSSSDTAIATTTMTSNADAASAATGTRSTDCETGGATTEEATVKDLQHESHLVSIVDSAKTHCIDGTNSMVDATSRMQAFEMKKQSTGAGQDDNQDADGENALGKNQDDFDQNQHPGDEQDDLKQPGTYQLDLKDCNEDDAEQDGHLLTEVKTSTSAEAADGNASISNAEEKDKHTLASEKKYKKKNKKKRKKKTKDVDDETSESPADETTRVTPTVSAPLDKPLPPAKPETPEEKLYRLLNLDTWDKGSFDNAGVFTLIQSFPGFCSRQFKFDDMHCKVYPLSMLCSVRAQLPTVKACYDAFPDALKETDNFVGTPLHYACTHRAPFDVVSFLVDKQPAHVKAENPAKRTPLHVACMAKASIETVELLVKRYTKALELPDRDGNLALHHACDTEAPVDVIKFLVFKFPAVCDMKNEEGYLPLHLAIKARLGFASIEGLVQASSKSVETPDPAGNLPLHLTLLIHRINTDFAVIEYLCRQYPEGKWHKNEKGYTPYDLSQLSLKRDTKVHALLLVDENA
ncbi:hypothetical protein MPSEU_000150200 [Mayamaea pseudoterrestris]|nr:hypothetical protein MPSEU_000150200 [Mayamaea pseudoterrestris]